MHIRKAAAHDLEHIAHLFAQLGYTTDPAQVGRQLRSLEDEDAGQALVAQAAGALVGVAVVHLIKPIHVPAPWALLSALVVDERSRSTGIGEALLAAAEEFAVAQGCSQLELSSSSQRTRAHMFYERNGYREKRLRFVKVFA